MAITKTLVLWERATTQALSDLQLIKNPDISGFTKRELLLHNIDNIITGLDLALEIYNEYIPNRHNTPIRDLMLAHREELIQYKNNL